MSVLPAGAATLLVPEELAAVRQAFAAYDRNGSGLIDTAELDNIMSQLGMELPEERLTRLKALLAEDNTKLIDLQSFTQLMSQQKPYMLDPLTHTQLAWIGLEGNDDFTGTVSLQALRERLKELGAELPDLDTFLQEHGLDLAQGMLNWADFHALMEVEGYDCEASTLHDMLRPSCCEF